MTDRPNLRRGKPACAELPCFRKCGVSRSSYWRTYMLSNLRMRLDHQICCARHKQQPTIIKLPEYYFNLDGSGSYGLTHLAHFAIVDGSSPEMPPVCSMSPPAHAQASICRLKPLHTGAGFSLETLTLPCERPEATSHTGVLVISAYGTCQNG